MDSLSTFTGNVDHVANGVGLRNKGAGTIRLRGAPATASPVAAILYFGFICETSTCPDVVPVSLMAESTGAIAKLDGIRIGSAPQPCWSGTTYGAYSVNVPLSLMSRINDDYEVDGVPSSVKDGSDPWINPGSPPLAEGASLVVVYSDQSISAPSVVYVNDGAMMFSSTVDIVNPVSPPLFGTMRKLTSIGADGQVGFNSTFAEPGISGEKTFIGPTSDSLTQIAGPGSTQDQDSDWNGNDGRPLNQLWDTSSHSFFNILPGGSTSYTVRYESLGDCIGGRPMC